MTAQDLANKNFYPTPEPLIDRMIKKVKGNPVTILEPSAGSGAIIERMKKYCLSEEEREGQHWRYLYPFEHCEYSAIEIDTDLQAILKANHNIRMLDTDFLAYSGPDRFDLIIANPPFDCGDLHLLKAIDILYRGEIVFLLNAETIRNPYTNSRKELKKRLAELNAEIEFIEEAFIDADRPTGVEVALIYIKIERAVEEDLFAGATDETKEAHVTQEQDYEVATKNKIEDLVNEYNQIIKLGTQTIIDYYRNYNKVGKYLGLNCEADKHWSKHKNMTGIMQEQLNNLLKTVRVDFWRNTLDIPEISSRMTTSRRKEFEYQLQDRQKMDFTASNIRQFIINLINNYESMLIKAVLELFDKLTIEHCYSDSVVDENVHYYNGWKTNKAFKVGKKVIIRVGYYNSKFDSGPFTTYGGRWRSDYKVDEETRDIDLVMSYFDASGINYMSIASAVSYWLDQQKHKNISSTYFTITCYKKGTMHLTFKDEDILRRFNVVACRGKGWLPMDYGEKRYAECDEEHKAVIREFEGATSYNKYVNNALFAVKPLPALMAA